MADDSRSLRDRLLPKGAVSTTMFVFALALGSAFSGTVLYAYYEFRLDQNEQRIAKFTDGFDERFDTATKTIDAETENAKADIAEALEPLRQIRAEGQTLDELVRKVSPAVWFVRTLDEAGQPSVASAFAVASDPDQTLLVTAYEPLRAASRVPGPAVNVRRGDQEVRATLWTWHEERDLALLVIDRGNQPKLDYSRDNLDVGERIFSVSGLGASGGAISQGFIADVSSATIQHDAAIGSAFQGGPLVNSDGEVVGVSSRAYAPLGFRSDGVWFGVPVRATCERVLSCPSGNPGAAGARSQPARVTTTTAVTAVTQP